MLSVPRHKGPKPTLRKASVVVAPAQESKSGPLRLKHDALSDAEKELVVLMFAKRDFQRTGMVSREAFAYWASQQPSQVRDMFDAAFPPDAPDAGINVMMWLAFCLRVERYSSGYISKELAVHGPLWHDTTAPKSTVTSVLRKGARFQCFVERGNNSAATKCLDIFLFFREEKTKFAKRGSFYWVELGQEDDGKECMDSDELFRIALEDPNRKVLPVHMLRTIYVGKTSRILGRLDLVDMSISPSRCFALVSRRGDGLYLVADDTETQRRWIQGIETILGGRIKHEFSSTKIAVTEAARQPQLFNEHNIDMLPRPIKLWFDVDDQSYAWCYADIPDEAAAYGQADRCISVQMLTDLYVGTNHEAFLNDSTGPLKPSCCFSLFSTKYNPPRVLHLESATPELAEAYIFVIKQFLAGMGRKTRTRTLAQLMSAPKVVAVVSTLDTRTPAIQRIMKGSRMLIYDYERSNKGRQPEVVHKPAFVWFEPGSGRYGTVFWNFLSPEEDDAVRRRGSISVSVDVEQKQEDEPQTSVDNAAEKEEEEEGDADTKSSTAHTPSPSAVEPILSLKEIKSVERCIAVHTLQSLVVGSANGVFPVLQHNDLSCFTLSALFDSVHFRAEDVKVAQQWRLGLKAVLTAQYQGLSNSLTGIEVNPSGSMFVHHPMRNMEYESSVHSLVSSTNSQATSTISLVSHSRNSSDANAYRVSPDTASHLHLTENMF